LTNNKPNEWKASIAFPVFKGDTEVVAFANEALSKRAQSLLADFLRQTKANIAALGHGGMEAKTDASISLIGRQLITGVMTSYAYVGGAHGMTNFLPYNFAMVAGKPKQLTFGDIFRPDAAAQVSERVLAKLVGVERAAWVAEGEVTGMTPIQLDRFVITKDGVKFLFDRYELGPYVAGSFTVTLLYSEIEDVLLPASPIRLVDR